MWPKHNFSIQTHFCLILSIFCIQLCSFGSSSIPQNDTKSETKQKSGNDTSSLENRIGLNLQHASAYGRGDDDSSSYSSQDSYAHHAGIYNADGTYQPWSSQAGTNSNAYSNGENAPRTWAETNSQVVPGYATGNGQAGVSGGWGSAETSGFSSNAQIPLGDTGSVLYSNLKMKTSNNATKTIENQHQMGQNNSTSDSTVEQIRKKKMKEGAITFENN